MLAAVDLFAEQGYDETTVAQIAERAGVTRSTFFRYFPDKRDVLAAGQETLSRLLTEGIAAAPADATPLQAVGGGLARSATAMGPMNRELAPRLRAVIAANAELRQRDAVKGVGMAAAMSDALVARGITEPVAQLAAEIGLLAFRRGFARWVELDPGADLAPLLLTELAALRAAAAHLG